MWILPPAESVTRQEVLLACTPKSSDVRRMTSTAASESPLDGVRGLVFFAFPLHQPGYHALTLRASWFADSVPWVGGRPRPARTPPGAAPGAGADGRRS